MTVPNCPLSLEEYRYVLRNDLTSFFHAAFYELSPGTAYVPGDHIDLIASKLEDCRSGKIKRLIINLPPRNLKSHCASICFPAFLLGHDPAARIICASYGQELAEKLARDTRSLMQSELYEALFSTRLSDRQAVHDFETNAGGFRMATSVGGPITGRGADFIILDDLIKPDDALSDVLRGAANNWFRNTLISRLNDKGTGCIIVVMQRLHQDDLVGQLLEIDDWEVLSLPAITEEDYSHVIKGPFGTRTFTRKAGEALHAEREPLETLRRVERDVGSYTFASQYQQSPVPRDGNLLKREWLKYYEPGSEPALRPTIIQSWDTANKSGEFNDYSVCTTWSIFDRKYYLLHVYRKKMEFPELRQAVIDLRKRFKPHRILIEDKASGVALIQELKNAGIMVTPYTPSSTMDKAVRFSAVTNFFESGQVLLPKEAHWLDEYVKEITGFPGTRYADQVDSTAQFLDHVRTKGTPWFHLITDEFLRQASYPDPTCRWARIRRYGGL